MKKARLLIFLIFTIQSTVSRAQDENTIFGDIELGKPLKLEKCIKEYDLYSGTKNNCYALGIDGNYLRFPNQERPKWLQWGKYAEYAVVIKIFNEQVGAVEMTTSGLAVQNDVLQTLIGKYGEPDTNKLIEKTNGYGAKMSSIEASWRKETILVYFSGITSVNSGRVIISTKDYLAYTKSKEVKKREL